MAVPKETAGGRRETIVIRTKELCIFLDFFGKTMQNEAVEALWGCRAYLKR